MSEENADCGVREVDVGRRADGGCAPVTAGPASTATDVDHLTPIADGGDDSLANLRPSCVSCNRGRR
jgi:5-methylcytosine-specific restriction endonuclease McrA